MCIRVRLCTYVHEASFRDRKRGTERATRVRRRREGQSATDKTPNAARPRLIPQAYTHPLVFSLSSPTTHPPGRYPPSSFSLPPSYSLLASRPSPLCDPVGPFSFRCPPLWLYAPSERKLTHPRSSRYMSFSLSLPLSSSLFLSLPLSSSLTTSLFLPLSLPLFSTSLSLPLFSTSCRLFLLLVFRLSLILLEIPCYPLVQPPRHQSPPASFPFCCFYCFCPCNSPSVFLPNWAFRFHRPSSLDRLCLSRLISMKPHSIWPIKEARGRFLGPHVGVPEKERKPGHGQASEGFRRY